MWNINVILIWNFTVISACTNNPCSNGATCQISGSGYICICLAGYSGSNCQTCKNLKSNQLQIILITNYKK